MPNAECRKETSLLVAVEKKAWQEKREVEDTRDQRSEDQKIKRSLKVPRSQGPKSPKNQRTSRPRSRRQGFCGVQGSGKQGKLEGR